MVDWHGEGVMVYKDLWSTGRGRCNSVAWIYDRFTPHLSRDALNTTTPNLAIYIYRTMHIYPWQIDSPSHLSIDALNTATPNLAHLMIEQCTYTFGRWSPPSQSSIDDLNTATPNFPDQYI